MEKFERLLEILRGYETLAIAFSGGVDSTLLAKAAARCLPGKTGLYLLETALHPAADLPYARAVAAELSLPLKVLTFDEFSDARILENTPERCYFCKRTLFARLKSEAQSDGYRVLADGTNADDQKTYRPGIKALFELGIESPLSLAGYTKEEIRRDAKELGISVHDRPSAPCLATRIPYGTKITKELLAKIEAGEALVREKAGVNVLRLRAHGNLARLEIGREEFSKIPEIIALAPALKALGFTYVALDLMGFRSGSMDEVL